MIGKLKLLGLTAVAVLAVSAVGASAASAADFSATVAPGTISGSGSGAEEFITEAGSVVCSSSTFTGSYENKTEASQTVHPSYSECKAFGFVSATVETEECDYVFTPTSGTSAEVDVACPEGQSIKITAATCSAEVKSQEGLSNVALENSGGGVNATPSVGGIAYTVTKDGFLCPFGGTGNKTGGEYNSTAAVEMTAAEGTIEVVG